MLKKVKLTDAEMREFAGVFAYYNYGDEAHKHRDIG